MIECEPAGSPLGRLSEACPDAFGVTGELFSGVAEPLSKNDTVPAVTGVLPVMTVAVPEIGSPALPSWVTASEVVVTVAGGLTVSDAEPCEGPKLVGSVGVNDAVRL